MSLNNSNMGLLSLLDRHPLLLVALAAASMLFLYLFGINWVMSGTPAEVRKVAQKPWTREQIKETYRRLQDKPVTVQSCKDLLPPKLERRYVVTGGSGLVGGYIVLQLLARGQPVESIRIVDFQKPNRNDMIVGPAEKVEFVKTDITSVAAVEAAFSRPWPRSVAHLPLTVFHTAAVIVPSDRSLLVYGFCESVNVGGTRNLLAAARRAGADVFVSTSSGSISVRPVKFWLAPWELPISWPHRYAQVLDEEDFFRPLRAHEDFFGNYPASKAAAERLVCGANSDGMRTGCVRPANGIYGNPTDNTVGGPLNMGLFPVWTPNIVQSFIHAVNCAIAHLDFEAVLAHPQSASLPQAGRPFTVTDPNAPIRFCDLWFMISTLSATPFRTIRLIPVVMLMISHAVEWYSLLPMRYPRLRKLRLPQIDGDLKHLKPPLFSITSHLIATNADVGRPVSEGGLAYKGVLTTLEGMVQEVLEWNQEHEGVEVGNRRRYISSVGLAEEIRKIGEAAMTVGG